MMLITLTILLPLVHTVAGTECHALDFHVVHTSTLPSQIKELIHKNGYIIWDDQNSFAAHYTGFPDSIKPDQFRAACVVGLKNYPFRHCVNATYTDGKFGGHNITVEEFQDFYKRCNNQILPDFDKIKIEVEDDFDVQKIDEKLELEPVEEED